MMPQIVPYAFPLFASAVVSCFIAGYAWRRRTTPGAVSLIVLSALIAYWSLCVGVSLFYHELAPLILLSDIQSVSLAFIPSTWLIFAFQYSRRDTWITRKALGWLAVEPVVFEMLLWTDSLHGWMRVGNRLDTASWPFPVHLSTFGIGYWAHVAYSYMLILIATVVLARELLRSYQVLYRGQSMALMLAMAAPWIGNVLQVAKRSPLPNMMMTPLAFGISNIVLAWGVLRYRLLDIVPMAREMVLEGMRDGVMVLDVHGRIVDLNPVAQQMLGKEASCLIGREAVEALPEWGDLLGTPMQEESVETIESAQTTDTAPGDETRQFDVHLSPLYNRRHALAGRLVVIQDTTERKQAEEERLKISKLESIGLLAGGIAHDFNNDLTGILGYLSFAKMDLEKEHPVYERLERAEEAALHARTLTRQLLAFARGGAPVKEVMPLREVLTSAAAFVLSGSNVRCAWSIPEDLWPAAIDAGQITQVIQNLIINADQAMPDGGVITIRCSNETVESKATIHGIALHPGFYVKISIRDQGTGIPEDQLSRIFDPYFTTKPTGAGLGLTTSYTIVKRHDGAISVSSTPGRGAVFDVYLPASTEQDEPALHPVPPSDVSAVPHNGQGACRILVMDDEPTIRKLSQKGLERRGYAVACARHGAEALELYERAMQAGQPFDVVIMDLTVPGGMGGKETIARLQAMDPGVRAIVSSGYSNDPVMADFEQYGFQARVAKPYRISDLAEAVRRLMRDDAETDAP